MRVSKRMVNLRMDIDLLEAVDGLAVAMGTDRTALIARGLRRELLHDGKLEFVYVLLDDAGEVRYVGRSCEPHKRLRAHVSGARAGGASAKEQWLVELLARGGSPRLAIIDDGEPGAPIRDLEEFWIKHFRATGRLTNGPKIRGDVLRQPGARSSKNVGQLDKALLDRVDARALELGQTRRVFTERALEDALRRAGPPDDAIHALVGAHLLCGQPSGGRRVVAAEEYPVIVAAEEYPVTDEGGAYCWTCLAVRRALSEAKSEGVRSAAPLQTPALGKGPVKPRPKRTTG